MRLVSFTFVGGKRTLNPECILYVQTEGHRNVFVVLNENEKTELKLYMKLDEIEKILIPYGFVRCCGKESIMLANVGSYFGTGSYYAQKTKASTGQSVASFGNTVGIHLHMTDPDGGDNAVTSVGFPDGSGASVYSAKGYSEYTVKYWNS